MLCPPFRRAGIHVWQVDLPLVSEDPRDWEATLSREERARCKSFIRPSDGRCYGLFHSALRDILAGYRGIAASRVQFEYGHRGKPRLADSDLRFNLSHSGDIALVAISQAFEVGIDVEKIPARAEDAGALTSLLSNAERYEIGLKEEGERPFAFYRAWSRKEAVVKALGEGLYYPLESFSIPLGPMSIDDPRSVALPGIACCQLRSSQSLPGYSWALAALGPCAGIEWLNYAFHQESGNLTERRSK